MVDSSSFLTLFYRLTNFGGWFYWVLLIHCQFICHQILGSSSRLRRVERIDALNRRKQSFLNEIPNCKIVREISKKPPQAHYCLLRRHKHYSFFAKLFVQNDQLMNFILTLHIRYIWTIISGLSARKHTFCHKSEEPGITPLGESHFVFLADIVITPQSGHW